MKLYFDKRLKDPTYYGQQGIRIGSKVTSKNILNFGKHSELLKITDDPEAYVREEIRKWNEEHQTSLASLQLTADFREKVKQTEAEASASAQLNIGYFVLQYVMEGLSLKAFFQNAVEDPAAASECFLILRFLTYARILNPRSMVSIPEQLSAFFEQPDFSQPDILRFLDILEDNYDGYLQWLLKYSDIQPDASVLYCNSGAFFPAAESAEEAGRFLKRVLPAKDGQSAAEYKLDGDKAEEEEKYDGYDAVITNLDAQEKDIPAAVQNRHRLEERFRFMRSDITENSADHLRARFLIGYTALLVYRLLEAKLEDQHTPIESEKLIQTLKNMNVAKIHDVEYMALYTGSETLEAVNKLTGLELDRVHYKPKELHGKIKSLLQ